MIFSCLVSLTVAYALRSVCELSLHAKQNLKFLLRNCHLALKLVRRTLIDKESTVSLYGEVGREYPFLCFYAVVKNDEVRTSFLDSNF